MKLDSSAQNMVIPRTQKAVNPYSVLLSSK